MAAKTADEYITQVGRGCISNGSTAQIWLRGCWDAATKAAEEKFNSAPTANQHLQNAISDCLDGGVHKFETEYLRLDIWAYNKLRKLASVQ